MTNPNIGAAAMARFQILARAKETAVVRRRFSAPWVTLYEWQCAGHAGHPEEEWADSHEVVVPRRGAFEWELAGERALADPGTATFLPAAEPYRVRHPLPGGDGGSVFRLAAGAVADLLADHDPGAREREAARFPVIQVPLDGRAYLLHCLAMRAAFDPGVDALEVEERALRFLREAAAQAFRRAGAARPRGAAGRSSRAREWVERAREVVARRYREPLTLGEVAREAGCSPFHLTRLVTAATGQPVYRMVLRRRLREALELLLETTESISRVALTVGFASHSHLTEAFRREFGVPPRAVRAGQLSAMMKGLPPTRALSFSRAVRASSRLPKGPARTL